MEKAIANGEFLEHAEYSRNLYGTRYIYNDFFCHDSEILCESFTEKAVVSLQQESCKRCN
jgi:guanylate kinase